MSRYGAYAVNRQVGYRGGRTNKGRSRTTKRTEITPHVLEYAQRV